MASIGELRALGHAALPRAALVCCVVVAAGCGAEPRDVLLVTIDTLRADRVGAYGNADARTPALDRLAESGVRFEEVISPAPITLPAHTSLMTAKIPPHHGVRDNGAYRLRGDHTTLAERLQSAGLATGAFVGAFVLDAAFGLAQGFDVYDDSMSGERSGAIGYAERRASEVVDAAVAWLRGLDTERRFFAWVHFYDPHADYDPPPGFELAFPGRPYEGEIAYADFQLDRLLAELAALGRLEDALIVATADHGESLLEHGEPTHTYFVYDATQRVPLLLAGPGVPRGAVVRAEVRLIDVAPTILDLLGLAALEGVDGESLVPAMRGGPGPEAGAYLETLATRGYGWSPLLGLRRAGWKYIRAPRPELYDLAADPGELVNRIAERPETARALAARLDEMLAGEMRVRETAPLDAEGRRRLEALGYVAPRQGSADAPLVIEGIDPKDAIAVAPQLNVLSKLLGDARYPDALALIEELRRQFPEGRVFMVYEALLRLRLGHVAKAAELAAEITRRTPSNAEAWVLRAEAEAGRGRLDQAHLALDEARRWQPENPLIERAAIAIELEAGELRRARRAADEGLAREPDDPELRVLSGRVHEAEGDLEAARRAYAAVLERAPHRPDANLGLALVEIASGETSAGLRRLDRVPAAQRAPLGTALRIARVLARAGEVDRAIEVLAPFQRPETESAASWDSVGALQLEFGRVEAAERALHRALELEPGRSTAANNLASLLARERRDLDLALTLAREAAAGAPGATTSDTLAEVHLARGEPGPALEAAGRGLEHSGAVAHLHYLRGRALLALGRREEASASLARAIAGAARPAPAWVAEARRISEQL